VFILNLLKYEICSILKLKRHRHFWTSILKSSLFWDFRLRRLAICYQRSGTTYPSKINLKTVVDDDNDDNDDTKNLCLRKKKKIIGNILLLVKFSLKFCNEIFKKF
jgi:hypothetical protein